MTVEELINHLTDIKDSYPEGWEAEVVKATEDDGFFDGEKIEGIRYSRDIQKTEAKTKVFLY